MKFIIQIDESRLNFPLRPMYAGRLASMYVTLVKVPEWISALSVIIHYRDPEGVVQGYAAPATATDSPGVWKCYIIPAAFPNVDADLKYDVVGYDDVANATWLGTGDLVTLDNPAAGQGDLPAVIPSDTYVRNPVTGLYHLVTATVNEYGEVRLSVAEEGVER